MDRVVNLIMELACGKLLGHPQRVVRGLKFQIDFIHGDGENLPNPGVRN
jgi:hypothetical protein